MRKFALAILTSGSLILSAGLASAGWYDAYGYYHCTWC